jgi:hypothetical protein
MDVNNSKLAKLMNYQPQTVEELPQHIQDSIAERNEISLLERLKQSVGLSEPKDPYALPEVNQNRIKLPTSVSGVRG